MKRKALNILLVMGITCAMLTGCGDKKPEAENSTQNVESQITEEVTDENAKADETENVSTDVQTTHDPEVVEADNENKAVETPAMTLEEQTLASLVGNWENSFHNDNNKDATATLIVKPSGEYEFKLVYSDGGWTHGEYSGYITIEAWDNDFVASFKLEKTSDANFDGWNTIGDFFIDSVRTNEYGTKCLYMTQANNGDSIFSMYFDEMRPALYAFDDPYSGENAAKYYEVKSPSDEYYYMGNETAKSEFELSQLSIEENDITDDDIWFNAIGEVKTDYYWMDNQYIYCKSNVRDYEYTQLDVYDNTSDDGEGKLLYSFNMSDFHVAGGFTAETAYSSFVSQGIKYALINDGILYISTGHRTYSDSCPETGYITAIDIETGKVLWKSAPRMCNSDTFAIVGNAIVCGYGFTAEPDFLNVIDIRTGSFLKRYDVKNAVDYVVFKNEKLYVRTYSYNYLYRVEYFE